MKKNDIVYYARIIPKSGIYDLCELKVRTVADTWFVGVDKKDKRAYILSFDESGITFFNHRKDALEKLREVERVEISTEIYYEED